MITIVNYKQFKIEIQTPESENDNTILMAMHWQEGHYNPRYFSCFQRWQFSAENEDPTKWVEEAVTAAIEYLDRNWLDENWL